MELPYLFLVEDDLDYTCFINDALTEIQPLFQWKFFQQGEDLLHYLNLAQIQPACIITDINMPGINGLEVLKEVKRNDKTAAIPVMLFTTSSCPNDIDTAFENNCDGYFIKGDTFEDFKDVLKTIVKSLQD